MNGTFADLTFASSYFSFLWVTRSLFSVLELTCEKHHFLPLPQNTHSQRRDRRNTVILSPWLIWRDQIAKSSRVSALFTFLLSRYKQGTDPDVSTRALLRTHKNSSRNWSSAKGELKGLSTVSELGINICNCVQLLISLGQHFSCHKGKILWFVLLIVIQHSSRKKTTRILSADLLLLFYRLYFASSALSGLRMLSKMVQSKRTVFHIF